MVTEPVTNIASSGNGTSHSTSVFAYDGSISLSLHLTTTPTAICLTTKYPAIESNLWRRAESYCAVAGAAAKRNSNVFGVLCIRCTQRLVER